MARRSPSTIVFKDGTTLDDMLAEKQLEKSGAPTSYRGARARIGTEKYIAFGNRREIDAMYNSELARGYNESLRQGQKTIRDAEALKRIADKANSGKTADERQKAFKDFERTNNERFEALGISRAEASGKGVFGTALEKHMQERFGTGNYGAGNGPREPITGKHGGSSITFGPDGRPVFHAQTSYAGNVHEGNRARAENAQLQATYRVMLSDYNARKQQEQVARGEFITSAAGQNALARQRIANRLIRNETRELNQIEAQMDRERKLKDAGWTYADGKWNAPASQSDDALKQLGQQKPPEFITSANRNAGGGANSGPAGQSADGGTGLGPNGSDTSEKLDENKIV